MLGQPCVVWFGTADFIGSEPEVSLAVNTWQLVPVNSTGQVQRYSPSRSVQVPPFLQGRLSHSLISFSQ